MTTLVLAPQIETKSSIQSTESRLTALEGYINDAVRHCGKRDRGSFDFEDMVQVATLEVWKELKVYPNAPIGYIWQVAYRAAIQVLRRGKSVDSPGAARRANYQVLSLEAILGRKDGQDTVDNALARRRRHGEMSNPTEDIAIARVMDYELRKSLTPRQEQVLDLRLQQYSESEIAAVLGITQESVSTHVIEIRKKANVAWGDKPQPPPRVILTPDEVRKRHRLRARKRYAQHREELNAKRGALRNALRSQWKEQGRCSRCGAPPAPGYKMCPECQLKARLERSVQRKGVNANGSILPAMRGTLGHGPRQLRDDFGRAQPLQGR